MKPILLVMAGPNGSGKSTISARFTPIGDYVNADVIEKELGISTRDAAKEELGSSFFAVSVNFLSGC